MFTLTQLLLAVFIASGCGFSAGILFAALLRRDPEEPYEFPSERGLR